MLTKDDSATKLDLRLHVSYGMSLLVSWRRIGMAARHSFQVIHEVFLNISTPTAQPVANIRRQCLPDY